MWPDLTRRRPAPDQGRPTADLGRIGMCRTALRESCHSLRAHNFSMGQCRFSGTNRSSDKIAQMTSVDPKQSNLLGRLAGSNSTTNQFDNPRATNNVVQIGIHPQQRSLNRDDPRH
jgi:hypothetical protein